MIIASTSQSITAILSGAATPAPTFVVGYHDPRVGQEGGLVANTGTLSATVATLVGGAIGAAVVDFVNIFNADNANITVTVNFVNSGTSVALITATLAAGDTLGWTKEGGWRVTNSAGQQKDSGASFTQGAALTAALTTITPADAAGTPDYAIAAVTDTTPFGFASAEEAITLLYVIKNLQVRVAEMEAALEGAGVVAAN